ncbi:hypothetical protein BDB01DRAFT_898500 [Pilobolus umbonatus]|nr:hypothetical protein BDB01DRAFT_898500 [Pilobolus umbonatus]
MSYSRVPPIQPYLQEASQHSVYRPAYHRTSPKKEWSVSPEISPIVVPSMSVVTPIMDYYQPHFVHINHLPYYTPIPIMHRQAIIPSNCHLSNELIHPIHHTLENATITYDTVKYDLQRELVKDVFFSPAMVTENEAMSDTESDGSSSPSSDDEISSPPPSELLMGSLFDFGLDLATTDTSNNTTTSSYEEVIAAAKKKPSFTLPDFHPFDITSHSLPTPPADMFHSKQTKRRCSDSVLQDRMKKKQRQDVDTTQLRRHLISLTPPSLLDTSLDYFDDASDEDSDEERTTLDYNHLRSFNLNAATEYESFSLSDNEDSSWEDDDGMDDSTKNTTVSTEKKSDNSSIKVDPRPTSQPTLFQTLSKENIDWCRYCGTTEGVNWRPGPWGKRTLCNKHGCDYKGYGFACKLPRLDLTGFVKESIESRDRPVLQLYCSGCQKKDSWEGNVLVRCEGCPKAFHQKCFSNEELTDDFVASDEPFFCDNACCENTRRKRIVVELPRKRLPLMCAPKNSSSSVSSVETISSRSRSSLRDYSR